MTSTLSPADTGTNILRPDRLRRPDVTGEQPAYTPATIGIVGEYPIYRRLPDMPTDPRLPVDELARLALGATLVHQVPLPPIDSLPSAVRRPEPTVHLAEVMPQPDVRPRGYRGRYRKAPWPRWAFGTVMFGSGWASCAAVTLAGLFALAAVR